MKKQTVKMLTGALGVLVISAVVSSPAVAQCGGPAKHVSALLNRALGGGRFQLVAAQAQSHDQWGEDERDADGMEPIVGLWKVDFEDPAHGYSDKGYSVWHSDHTEFLNSTRPPSTGAVCQGVWKKVGRSTYRLNHFAIGYSNGTTLDGLFRFTEIVTVDRSRNHFSGAFSIEAVDPKTHAPLGVFSGTITGKRVRIDSTIDSQQF